MPSSASRRHQGTRGFSLVEVIVASGLGLLILAIAMQTVLTNQILYRSDIARTRLNQNLRSGLDIIGIAMREAGEDLPSAFPAIEVINGSDGAPDQIFLKRNLAPGLRVCQPITVSSPPQTNVVFGVTGVLDPGCAFDAQLANYAAWVAENDERVDRGERVEAYVYDYGLRQGEFFPVSLMVSTATTLEVQTISRTWQRGYAAGAPLYMMEQSHFRVNEGYLELITNEHTDEVQRVVGGITDLQVIVRLTDGSEVNGFTRLDSWERIHSIRVTLSGEDMEGNRPVVRTLEGVFFPRNVLSL